MWIVSQDIKSGTIKIINIQFTLLGPFYFVSMLPTSSVYFPQTTKTELVSQLPNPRI